MPMPHTSADAAALVDAVIDDLPQTDTENSPSVQPEPRVLVPQPHGGAILSPIRTREQAQAMVAKNWDRYRRAAEHGMVSGVLDESDEKKLRVTKRAAVTAYSKIVKTQARAANTIDRFGRTNTPAARFVREAIAADVGAPAQRNSATDSGITVTLSISADVAASLAERLAKLLGGA